MSEMIERVASTMWGKENPGFDWDDSHEKTHTKWLGRARAAIEAMRIPTAAMCDAAQRAGGEHEYTAMIDAALKQEGG